MSDYGETTEAAEQKQLIETATRLGYELGRKEALAEVAAAISNRAKIAQRIDPRERSGVREGMVVAWIAAEKLAQDMASQPSGATSEPLTALEGHSDLPPRPECPGCGQSGTGLENHYNDCPQNPYAEENTPPDLTKGGQ